MRLDVYLVERGFAPSRQKAQELLSQGQVYVNGVCVQKPAYTVDTEKAPELELRGRGLVYVSRGGLKLEAALDAFGISVQGVRAVDIGASTGGFTDCLLQRGAATVYAVDCGTEQLHPTLKNDARVHSFENCNARTVSAEMFGGECDLVVMDVSFISQTQLFCAVCAVLKKGGKLISLIKPQFEAGRAALSRRGIVKDEKVRRICVKTVCDTARQFGLHHLAVIPSPIVGGDGNQEYLALFEYTPVKEGT